MAAAAAPCLLTTTVCFPDAQDTQFVVGVVEAKMEAYRTEFGRSPTVRAAATVTRNLCYANKDQLSAGIICAGWDAREGGAVFSIPQVCVYLYVCAPTHRLITSSIT